MNLASMVGLFCTFNAVPLKQENLHINDLFVHSENVSRKKLEIRICYISKCFTQFLCMTFKLQVTSSFL